MAKETLLLSRIFPVSADRLHAAWLDEQEHAAFTGGPATIEPRVGGAARAWDGYIDGRFVSIEPGRIVQTWRTTDFGKKDEDSRLEIRIEPAGAKRSTLTLIHSDIPEGQGERYEEGWVEYYFTPMNRYFDTQKAEKKAAKKAAKAEKKTAKAEKKTAKAEKQTAKAEKKAEKKAAPKKAVVKKAAQKAAPKKAEKKAAPKKAVAKKAEKKAAPKKAAQKAAPKKAEKKAAPKKAAPKKAAKPRS